MAPMKMTSISVSNINMANYSNHRVRKVKQLLNLNGQITIKYAKRILLVNLNVFCTICRCDISIAHRRAIILNRPSVLLRKFPQQISTKSFLNREKKLIGPCNFEEARWNQEICHCRNG